MDSVPTPGNAQVWLAYLPLLLAGEYHILYTIGREREREREEGCSLWETNLFTMHNRDPDHQMHSVCAHTGHSHHNSVVNRTRRSLSIEMTSTPSLLMGKSALITGAGNGIGLACAQIFARAGAKVVLADINLAAAESGAKRIQEDGMNAYAVACDVSKVGVENNHNNNSTSMVCVWNRNRERSSC